MARALSDVRLTYTGRKIRGHEAYNVNSNRVNVVNDKWRGHLRGWCLTLKLSKSSKQMTVAEIVVTTRLDGVLWSSTVIEMLPVLSFAGRRRRRAPFAGVSPSLVPQGGLGCFPTTPADRGRGSRHREQHHAVHA
jgi:hypothetical protein